MEKSERFVEILRDKKTGAHIYADKVTGVNYLYITQGYGAGLSPLLDRDGKPMISSLPIMED